MSLPHRVPALILKVILHAEAGNPPKPSTHQLIHKNVSSHRDVCVGAHTSRFLEFWKGSFRGTEVLVFRAPLGGSGLGNFGSLCC